LNNLLHVIYLAKEGGVEQFAPPLNFIDIVLIEVSKDF
jgi:hypothetical protein